MTSDHCMVSTRKAQRQLLARVPSSSLDEEVSMRSLMCTEVFRITLSSDSSSSNSSLKSVKKALVKRVMARKEVRVMKKEVRVKARATERKERRVMGRKEMILGMALIMKEAEKVTVKRVTVNKAREKKDTARRVIVTEKAKVRVTEKVRAIIKVMARRVTERKVTERKVMRRARVRRDHPQVVSLVAT